MIAFREQQHHVISLSQASGAQIHDYLRLHGIETHTHVLNRKPGVIYYLQHIFWFIKFCRKHKVDVVYSHLEPANLVSVVAQYFVKARVIIVRHHIDEARLFGFDKSFSYRLTYRLAKDVIVVSKQARQYMIDVEKVNPGKIRHINLAYDFSLYPPPNASRVQEIKGNRYYQVTLLTAGRLNQFKRPELSIEVVKELKARNVNARLLLLGRGVAEESLKNMIREHGLEDNVQIVGYVSNVTDYMAISDFLLHPSVAESSCVVVKEAALTRLPVVVCKGIGDFDDYIEHENNGFIVDRDTFVKDTVDLIIKNLEQPIDDIASRLYEKVTSLFSVDNILHKYETLNN
jgi:glycosyltransferase involved in cell wall biosynthesis